MSTASPSKSGPVPERRAAEVSASRLLLRRLVEVMAAPVMPQERLNRIVRIIANDIVAEVCSVYVQRAGNLIELFATEGLAPEAVHKTRLRVGEGMVGTIAAQGTVINTEDAQSHPAFVFRPETGEQVYHSFLGVPLLRGGAVAGVLTVQNRAQRRYADDEVEALQIVAGLLAEMLVSGELIDTTEYSDVSVVAPTPRRFEGVTLVPGVAIGQAVLHRRFAEVTQLVADDPDHELARLDTAMVDLRTHVDELLTLPGLPAGEHHEVLEAYRMFAHDRGWFRRMREAIQTGISAEAAVNSVHEETRLRLSQISDAYLRERLLDLDDLTNRLLSILAGRPHAQDLSQLPDRFILVARSLSPAELIEYEGPALAGVILEEGSVTAHVTIVARALDIPLVGRAEGATAMVNPGDVIALDGDHGHVLLRPGDDVRQAFETSLAARAERRRRLATLRDLPTRTRDGVPVSLLMNAAFPFDMPHLDETGADGIGLYRTEIAFMARERFPDVDEQAELYGRVIEQANGKTVTFRTLDVGSDKLVPYWRFPDEENPAMGWRAIRMSLDQPQAFRGQLRALIRAAAGHTLSVMFPMVSEVAEFEAARRILDMEHRRAEAKGQDLPARIEVGCMIEVPALVWQMPALLKCVDFVSLGTNDLMQFVFASDRGSPGLIGRYDALAPAALSLIRDVTGRCQEAGVRLTICGEMASQVLEAMALVGVGVRNLSLMPTDFWAVKAMLRSLEVSTLAGFMDGLYDLPDRSLRGRLRAFALDHGVDLASAGSTAA